MLNLSSVSTQIEPTLHRACYKNCESLLKFGDQYGAAFFAQILDVVIKYCIQKHKGRQDFPVP